MPTLTNQTKRHTSLKAMTHTLSTYLSQISGYRDKRLSCCWVNIAWQEFKGVGLAIAKIFGFLHEDLGSLACEVIKNQECAYLLHRYK